MWDSHQKQSLPQPSNLTIGWSPHSSNPAPPPHLGHSSPACMMFLSRSEPLWRDTEGDQVRWRMTFSILTEQSPQVRHTESQKLVIVAALYTQESGDQWGLPPHWLSGQPRLYFYVTSLPTLHGFPLLSGQCPQSLGGLKRPFCVWPQHSFHLYCLSISPFPTPFHCPSTLLSFSKEPGSWVRYGPFTG